MGDRNACTIKQMQGFDEMSPPKETKKSSPNATLELLFL